MAGWQTILFTALLTTIGTAAVSYLSHRWTVRSDSEAERKRHARYLAIRVVCVLDTFVSECGEVVYDDGMPDNDGITSPRVSTPTLSLPADVDWRTVEPGLMYRALGFHNEILSADKAIAWMADETSGPPDYDEFFTERKLQYGQLGLAALQLADDLRKRYGVPARNYENWKPCDVLTKKIAEAKAEKAESASMQQDITENVEAKIAAGAERADPEKSGA